MRLISKYKVEILISFFLIVAYFIFRLIYLDKLPIFTDEAIYIRWAQIELHDASWRFISLIDGKQPMFVWIMTLFMKFINDPLTAGRLASVFSGFFTMVGLWLLTYELFKNKKVAFLSSILYVFYPFAQVYNRMALMDGTVAMFTVWALYFSVLLVKKLRLDIAYTLAFVIGGGVLTKSNAFFSMYLLPFTLLLFDFKSKFVLKRLFKWILLVVFSSVIAYAFYNVLRLSPFYQTIAEKNATFVYPFSLHSLPPITFFLGNVHGLLSWLIQYLKLPYIILIIISYFFAQKYFKEKILLTIYFILPFVALAFFGKVIYPRFIYFMSLMLLPLAALGLDSLINLIQQKVKLPVSKNTLTIILAILFILHPAYVSLQFVYDPIRSQIADADKSQYLNGWASGWGVKDSIIYFQEQAKNQKIFVATEGTFGLMPYALEMYLVSNKNITIRGYWPINDELPKETLEYAKKMPSFFVFYQPQHEQILPSYPLKLVFEAKQGNSNSYYRVYQIENK